MPTLTANRDTIARFRATERTLLAELERIAEMTNHYPVICTFAGNRVVFESREDVLSLIEEIRDAVARYEQAA